MNIDRLNQNLASSAYGLRGKRAGEAGAAGDAPAADGTPSAGAAPVDGVEVSAEGRLLQRANAAVRAAPDVRADLVQKLHDQVQSGAYLPNDEAVAQALTDGDGQ